MPKKGRISWNKGLCKEDDPRLMRQSLKLEGRTKDNNLSVKRQSQSLKEYFKIHSVWNKDKELSDDHKRKISQGNLGKKRTEEWKIRNSETHKGEKNGRWIIDRTKLAKRQERNDSAYGEWRIRVWIRDGFKCRIANDDCKGRLEAHHILGWMEYPELRYEVNNGITLCHAYHPTKRAEEKRLIPIFKELVSVSKE